MGIRMIYSCDDEEGCDAREEFSSGTDLRNLQKGGWLEVPTIGGRRVYCPKHRAKYDSLRAKEAFRLRPKTQTLFEEKLEKGIAGL
jgi:hypothetical protein